ncbi:MAG: hypothetical protein ACLRR3_01095 [Eubacterium sp.]
MKMNKLGKIFNVAFVVVFYMMECVLVVGNMITGSYIASLLSGSCSCAYCLCNELNNTYGLIELILKLHGQ